MGKCRAVIKCNLCNTKAVQLHRMPGWTGFQQRFKGMSQEERERFWSGAKETHSGQELQAYLQDQVELSNSHEETQSSFVSGEYLPLGVYAARGFDAATIEAKCSDVKDRAIFLHRFSFFASRDRSQGRSALEIAQTEKGVSLLPRAA